MMVMLMFMMVMMVDTMMTVMVMLMVVIVMAMRNDGVDCDGGGLVPGRTLQGRSERVESIEARSPILRSEGNA